MLTYFDVSKYQGAYKPGVHTAVCARVGYGTTKDPQFSGIRARAAGAHTLFLPYHYLTTGSSAAHQADLVKSWVGAGVSVMLDVELGSGTLRNVLDFIDAYNRIAEGGRVVLAYIPHWYWQGHMGSPSLLPLSARHCGLVSSDYTTLTEGGPGWRPYGGVSPVIWQYSTAGNLDHNAYRGTLDQLAVLWGITKPKPPEDELPTPDDVWNYKFTDDDGTAHANLVKAFLNTESLKTSVAALAAAVKALSDKVDALGSSEPSNPNNNE